MEGCPIVISRTVLIASSTFDQLSAQQVGSAIARGLDAGGLQSDVCPIRTDVRPIASEEDLPTDVRALLEALDFDARMLRARAVVLAEARLAERTLTASPAFEIATRARQAGVPAYAVAAQNLLDPFDARILDLQVILEASSPRALTAAGRRLAELV
jgi:glycerate kinase